VFVEASVKFTVSVLQPEVRSAVKFATGVCAAKTNGEKQKINKQLNCRNLRLISINYHDLPKYSDLVLLQEVALD
jgi:hypothetical protein